MMAKDVQRDAMRHLPFLCGDLGLPTSVAPAEVRIASAGPRWSLRLACRNRDAEGYVDWMHAASAYDVQRGAPHVVRRGGLHRSQRAGQGGGWPGVQRDGPRHAAAAFQRDAAFPVLSASQGTTIRGTWGRLPQGLGAAYDVCRFGSFSLAAGGHANVNVRTGARRAQRMMDAVGHVLGPLAVGDALTARQDELVRYCIDKGYYEIPHALPLRELGRQLGISSASLSLLLRRAEGKIMRERFARIDVNRAAAEAAGRLPAPSP